MKLVVGAQTAIILPELHPLILWESRFVHPSPIIAKTLLISFLRLVW